MSRRREAAELARVLLLSTQEASTAAHLSPHALSSSKSGTQDSREMELRAVEPGHPADPVSGNMADSIVPLPSGDLWGFPPAVRTIAQDQSQGAGEMLTPAGDALPDPIVTTTSSHDTTSNIASFTPSHRPPLEATPCVPASSDQRDSPATLHPVPGSGTSRAPFSSPNMPIPSSRISSDKSHVSSSGSSHRALFSPTQTSSRPIPTSTDSPRPRLVVTYGKNLAENGRQGLPGVSEGRQRSPLKAADPPLIYATTSRPRLPLSDDEDEIDETIEAHQTAPKASFEVVLPYREPSNAGKLSSPHGKGPREHPDSPDPLDNNIRRPSVRADPFPLDPLAPLPTQLPVLVSPTKSTHSHGTGTQRSDKSAGPTRVSHRQQMQKEKEEAEKEAKREARRIRKEMERLDKERQEAEARKSRDRGSRPGRAEEESVVPLETPGSSRKSKIKAVTKSPASPPSEVIVIEDETMPAEKAAGPRSPTEAATVVRQEDPGEDVPSDRKRRRNDEEGEGEWKESGEDVPTKATRKKAADAKRKDKKKSKAKASASVTEALALDKQPNESNGVDQRSTSSSGVAGREAEEKAAEEDDEGEEAGQQPSKDLEVSAEDQDRDKTTTSISPVKSTSIATNGSSDGARTPLRPIARGVNTPQNTAHRPSPGPSTGPKGYQWRTERNDLASVLSKFGGARQSGMSRRSKIVPLHMKIGPPAKALPPPPPKPSKKKKDSDEDEDGDSDAEMESDGEGGLKRKKKEKGIEWFMVED